MINDKSIFTEKNLLEDESKIPLLSEEIFWSDSDSRWDQELYRGDSGHWAPEYNYLLSGSNNGSRGRSLNLARKSYIWCFSGPRGAGKTSLMSYTAEQCACLYGKRIISNYPIAFRVWNGDPHEIKVYRSEPLELGKLLMFDESYAGAIIVMDEAPQIINRLATMTWKNRLLDLWLQQIRKNENSLLYASQNEHWVDNELRWQTDISTHCRDGSIRYPEYKEGSMVLTEVKDLSGLWTGYSYEERPRVAKKQRCITEVIWDTFDTKHQIDVFESLAKVKMNVGEIEVGVSGGDDNSYLEHAIPIITQTLETGRIRTRDFYAAIGGDINKTVLGRRLRESGVRDTGNGRGTMDFADFDMDKFMAWKKKRR